MDIKQLQYFIRVAESGSVTRAAALLGMSQPALSWQIGKLETELTVPLFSRNGRGVVLTDAGALFLRRAKALAEDADRARREMREFTDHPAGVVTVGLPPSVAAIIVMPMVERLNRRFPKIKLQIVEGYSGYVCEWLQDGRIDVGIVYGAGGTPSVDCQPLVSERLYLLEAADGATRGDDKIQFCRLGDIPLILPSPPHAIRRLIDQFSARHHLTLNIRMEVSAFASITNLVTGGHGATILPIAPMISEVRDGRLKAREIVNPSLSQVVGVAASTQRPTAATQAVMDVIRDVTAILIAEGRWPADMEKIIVPVPSQDGKGRQRHRRIL